MKLFPQANAIDINDAKEYVASLLQVHYSDVASYIHNETAPSGIYFE